MWAWALLCGGWWGGALGDRLDLGGKVWELTGASGERLGPVEVPGDVYSDLRDAGRIPEPLLGDHDQTLRHVSLQNWTYRRSFRLPPNSPPLAFLHFHGLDTVATVRLNRIKVGESRNMFREYVFNVSGALRAGPNEVEVEFASAVAFAKAARDAFVHRFNYSVPPSCPPALQQPSCHSNFVRKMQSSFSWDWGPAFPGAGIWRPVALHSFRSLFLRSLSAVAEFREGQWTLAIRLRLWASKDTQVPATFRLLLLQTWHSRLTVHQGWNRLDLRLPLTNTSDLLLWWPRGYGDQPLYTFFAELSPPGEEHPITSDRISIGFRQVRLNQDLVSHRNRSQGRNFYLEVNGVGVFLKGTNWIPASVLPGRVAASRLEALFEAMAWAGVNAMRVWGGGVYESQTFYSMADRLGILVWQDAMFAVALYPADPAFLAEARAEVEENAERLAHHASVALWAGNNENELGLRQGWFQAERPAPPGRLRSDYLALYNGSVWAALNDSLAAATTPFVLSSPSNGLDSLAQGGIAANPADPAFGDLHYYNYAGDAWDARTFPRPRCVTEFGYQSLPSFQSLREDLDVDEEKLGFWAPALLHRQHHPLGNLQMLASVLQHFALPRCHDDGDWLRGPGTFQLQAFRNFSQLCTKPFGDTALPPEAQFLKDMTYLTQLHQAVAYKTEVEHYRRWQNRTDGLGRGNTMCALYWQLNDVWTAPSWSSVDFKGRWKAAHYLSKGFFAPLLLSPYLEDGNLNVALVNEGAEPVRASLGLNLFAFSAGLRPVLRRLVALDPVPARASRVVYTTNMASLLSLASNRPTDVQPSDLIVAVELVEEDGSARLPPARNVLLPSRLFESSPSDWGRAEVAGVELVGRGRLAVDLRLSEPSPTPFVWLEVDEAGLSTGPDQPLGHFSDNAFTMLSPKLRIFFDFFANSSLSVAEFRRRLSVQSLKDLYVSASDSSPAR